MRVRSKRDFWSGLMFAAIGAAFAIAAQKYRLGTAAQMGPGWFPTALAVVLTLIGSLISIGAFARGAAETHVEPVRWREVIYVLSSVAAFAFLLPYAGVIVSVLVLVLVATRAERAFRIGE